MRISTPTIAPTIAPTLTPARGHRSRQNRSARSAAPAGGGRVAGVGRANGLRLLPQSTRLPKSRPRPQTGRRASARAQRRHDTNATPLAPTALQTTGTAAIAEAVEAAKTAVEMQRYLTAPLASLTLPNMIGVPPLLKWGQSLEGPNMAAVAEGMMQAGMLTEDDWGGGDLGSAIYSALFRWMTESGLAHTNELDLTLGVHATEGNIWEWSGEENIALKDGIGTAGAFFFKFNPYGGLPSCQCGRRIMQLEDLYEGVGLAVLGVVCEALQEFNGVTPSTAFDTACQWWDPSMEDPEIDYESEERYIGEMRPQDFYATVPEEVVGCKADAKLIKKVLSSIGYESENAEGRILQEALELHKALQVVSKRCGKGGDLERDLYLYISAHQLYPFVLHWADGDAVWRVIDDELEMLSQIPEECANIAWLSSFTVEDVDSVRIATERLKLAAPVLVRLNWLLKNLHDEKPIAAKGTLIEVFDREERQQVRIRV